ncbi:WXG100 family type VII secretion target [Kibdelosporangium banguiense]|uniref:ESAT-6-like protein n=1 Tax=Kibdelosporangium banguiense TaxID=1365924 RepID=A0ABS4TF76_9PSEU|nr:WXG100 family type VII secretion target [Kibdelosporangium banguiense]MBP2322508.1 WXG100 family type VII secretion target [Kibdelosporangium banguiense]
MPNGTFEITPEMLHKASVDTDRVRNDTQGYINTLRNQLGSLEGAWAGAAATAFHSLIGRFNEASNKVLQDLQTISESLATSAKEYGHREEESQSTFTKAEGNFSF